MKKFLAVLLLLTLAATMCVSCAKDDGKKDDPADTPDVKGEGVMTYAEYVKAKKDDKVVIETYVQAKQGWWEKDGVGVATFYTQDKDGAYFIYDMPCSKADYDKLVKGTKIKVEGFKAEWSGEVEIIDAKFTILEGNFIAPATDVTDKLASEELINFQNRFVTFKGMEIVASKDKDGKDAAFLYKWDGSGQEGDDLYFKVKLGDKTYTFTVESYLCGKDTDVYKAVQNLKVGDKVDMEGFLYWYEGVNPHITSVKVVK